MRLLVELGWDVNHLRRSTALHEAAWRGDLGMARLLVELGADPTIEDTEHHGTPAGWAFHGGQDDVLAYLEGVAAAHPGAVPPSSR